MEYTKDIVLSVNYGQARKERKKFSKLINMILNHKIIITIFFITVIMIILDFILIKNFVEILNKI